MIAKLVIIDSSILHNLNSRNLILFYSSESKATLINTYYYENGNNNANVTENVINSFQLIDILENDNIECSNVKNSLNTCIQHVRHFKLNIILFIVAIISNK